METIVEDVGQSGICTFLCDSDGQPVIKGLRFYAMRNWRQLVGAVDVILEERGTVESQQHAVVDGSAKSEHCENIVSCMLGAPQSKIASDPRSADPCRWVRSTAPETIPESIAEHCYHLEKQS